MSDESVQTRTDEIVELASFGESIEEIAARTGTMLAVVRVIVESPLGRAAIVARRARRAIETELNFARARYLKAERLKDEEHPA